MAAPKGNKYAIGNNGGRPPTYDSAKKLAKAIDEYFVYILGEYHIEAKEVPVKQGRLVIMVKQNVVVWDREPEPATVTGLALFLGFADRQSLYDYQKIDEFTGIIKRARTRVEMNYEQRLHGDGSTGAIFALKNMGWVDKTETDITTKGQSINGTIDLSKLSDAELEEFERLTAITQSGATGESAA